jgi:hypothetical protein
MSAPVGQGSWRAIPIPARKGREGSVGTGICGHAFRPAIIMYTTQRRYDYEYAGRNQGAGDDRKANS